jgi:hypothetical protein
MADARKRPSHNKGHTLKMPAVADARRLVQPPPADASPTMDTLRDEPRVESQRDTDPVPPTDISNRGELTLRTDESGIEISMVREEASARRVRQPWRAVEVWTKNRVYGMDSSFTCIEVVDRDTGKEDPDHPYLGGKLGGGRTITGRGANFTHPLPLPGNEAMFLRDKKQGFTSVVERVVLRIRELRVKNSKLANFDHEP